MYTVIPNDMMLANAVELICLASTALAAVISYIAMLRF